MLVRGLESLPLTVEDAGCGNSEGSSPLCPPASELEAEFQLRMRWHCGWVRRAGLRSGPNREFVSFFFVIDPWGSRFDIRSRGQTGRVQNHCIPVYPGIENCPRSRAEL